jgi:hypothetical protein
VTTSDGDVFGIDVAGWVEQHRSRDVYEVVREPIQNALDTGSDLYVQIDYDDTAVVVEDYAEAGVDDLSQFYDLFAGDKQYDPEQRGRFGRGVKEFIGASDETVISSTGGALWFQFDTAVTDDGVTVDATRATYPDAARPQGTVVYGTNTEWTRDDLDTVEDFVDRLWLPEDQALTLDVYDDGERPARSSIRTHKEPDAVLERQSLPTLVVEDGVQQEQQRRTTVEVMKTEPGDGAVYELGIPVTTGEAFPVRFNVQQKTPVTERRNELDNSYRTDLMQSVIDERLDLFDDAELGEEYVTRYLSQFTHRVSRSTQQAYIERRFGTASDDLLVYTDSTPSIAVTWAMQRDVSMENADEYSSTVRSILTTHCPSVQEWYDDQQREQSITVVDDPGDAQEAFVDYLESEIFDRTTASDVAVELAFITEDTADGQTQATYSPADETIYLNALADTWNDPTPRRIGTALHELGHHETDPSDDGHGPDWYRTVEELSGEVIYSLQDEFDALDDLRL